MRVGRCQRSKSLVALFKNRMQCGMGGGRPGRHIGLLLLSQPHVDWHAICKELYQVVNTWAGEYCARQTVESHVSVENGCSR